MNKLTQWTFKLITFLASVGVLSSVTPLFSDSHSSSTILEANQAPSSLIQTTRQQVATLANNNKSVLTVYDNLMGIVQQAAQENVFTSADVDRICAAICFAAEEHQLQTRKNAEKTPYICHPLEVTYDLMKVGQVRDVSVIIGAILHDTSLEKKAAIKELSQKFGSVVANLVKEVKSHPISAQKAHQRDLMIHAADQSKGSAQIELADLLCSLKELSSAPPAHWNKERIDHYFQWAQAVVDRFPEANKPLHDAVKATILAYWEHQ